MSGSKTSTPRFDLDPGAFNAALFQAYKGDCDCDVCKILRNAVSKVIAEYIPKGE